MPIGERCQPFEECPRRFNFHHDRLDIAIAKADRNVAMMTSDDDASIVIEAMLPHKQHLRDYMTSCSVSESLYQRNKH